MNRKQARAAAVSPQSGVAAAAVAVWLMASGSPVLAAESADTLLVNGKIITVDDRFTIAQGVAIKGQRIVAVGKTGQILKLKGAATKVIDLANRTVIPGLIDNHAHFIRAPEHDEMRLDGVTSRREALRMLAARVRAARPGEWIVTLGGWSEEQFTDDPRGFPLEELDRIAPGNPVVLQAVYNQSYLNSAALKAAGIDAATPDPRGGLIEKDASGKPTGVVRNAGGVAFVAAKIPLPDRETWLANVRKFVAELNAMGITAWYDAGGRGMSEQHYEAYRTLADRGELNARAFWTTIRQPTTPEQVGKVLAEIAQQTSFQGDDYFDNIGWGESVYTPATTNLLRNDYVVKPEDMREVRRIAHALAEGGMFLNAHVEMENAISAYLDEYEVINKVEPIKGLRWALSHLDQVTDAQLARMKRLGLYAGLHSRPLIQGALMHKVHGERAWDMPPFRRVQDSGIVWGLGSDATAVTTSNPFYTLWFAVTGKMIGGRQVNRQTITREEALIAHTRSNAHFVFQESNLGSIQPGKYADLLVLDRDYLKVPAEQIKDIKPVMTMVGGKTVRQTKGL
ncbi:MAG TPA: amidohydrolase [Burkholderiales bacterium]|nr:amidohydrolase [Burkholderiales bacterium]